MRATLDIYCDRVHILQMTLTLHSRREHEGCYMSNTVKIPRPDFRRTNGSGRVEHDDRGNAIWVRSRASDTPEVAIAPTLAILDDIDRRTREYPSVGHMPSHKQSFR